MIAVGFNRDSEGEGADRTFSLPIGQNELIRELSSQNKNSIVAITSGGAVDAASWIDQVAACLELWYPGEQGGTALAEILFGDVNPSGRLPITFERKEGDNPSFSNYYPESGSNRVLYKEGIFVGYRGYEHTAAKPLFPFGFGLSYTRFTFANLQVTDQSTSTADKYVISFDVTNSGNRSGAEVAQVYVSDTGNSVPRPAKELKGFMKVSLQAGETRHVSIPLDTRAFAYYDVTTRDWQAPAGNYRVLVGKSSEEIALSDGINLATTVIEKP